jgi:ABC-type lipoprotein release transport system permease subunit
MKLPFTLLVRLSWRNLWRHRRRNSMLLAAIVVAVGTVVFANAVIRGYQGDMLNDAINNLTGHVKVLAPGYRSDPSIEKSFAVAPEWQPPLDPSLVLGWTSRVRVPAVIMSERETRGVQLVGVDPGTESLISFLGEVDIVGEYLEGPDDRRVLIGRALAEQLETKVGRRIVMITQGSDGLNREAGFRIAGLYDGEGTGVEKVFVFTGRDALQAMLDTTTITEISVRLIADEYGALAGRQLAESFADLEVMSWRQLQPQVAAMFAFADMAIFIWFTIMMIALGFGLINTLVTAVLERTRELGMLRALGMRPRAVVAQVVIESVLIVSVGLVLGLAVGVWLISLLDEGIDLGRWAAGGELWGIHSVLVPQLLMADLVLVAIMTVIFGVIASFYPALRAVKIRPLEAMRR